MRLFSGSIGRIKFLSGYLLFLVLAYGVASLVTQVSSSYGPLAFIFGLIATPLVFALVINRLHDLNQSGWLSLLILIPIVQLAFFVYLALWPGTPQAQ